MTLNKAALIVGGIIIFIIAVWAFMNISPFLSGLFGGPKSSVTINDKTFKVTLADTPEKREIGLSGKNSLPKDQGLLFIFDSPSFPPFWMRNMKFPIDIIFINKDKVVTVYDNVQPPTEQNGQLPLYKPTAPADRVLEINAGLAEEYGIQAGDTVQFDL